MTPTNWPDAVISIGGMIMAVAIVLAVFTDFWEGLADALKSRRKPE